MRGKDVAVSAVVVLVVILTAAGPALAQTNLVPNEPIRSEHLPCGQMRHYMTDLESGHWTVAGAISSSLGVRITVALDNSSIDVIAYSWGDVGNFPAVDFTLNESATVYIRVFSGDTDGFYSIGVYDDDHVPKFRSALPELDSSPLIILSIAGPLVICIVCLVTLLRGNIALGTISTDSDYDITVLPRKTRRLLREQLPTNCPNCDGGLTYGTVRWVGPRTAECPYCGNPVLLEIIEIVLDET
jgi:hypothetical protein